MQGWKDQVYELILDFFPNLSGPNAFPFWEALIVALTSSSDI